MAKRLVRENPAMFLGEARMDLERIYAIDDKTHSTMLLAKEY